MTTLVPPTLLIIVSATLLMLEILIIAYLFVNITNYFYNKLNLKNIEFSSSLELKEFAKIYIKNTILLILTLGIYTPWARINVLQYRISSISVITNEQELENFIASNKPQNSAFAEEGDELLDLDTGGF